MTLSIFDGIIWTNRPTRMSSRRASHNTSRGTMRFWTLCSRTSRRTRTGTCCEARPRGIRNTDGDAEVWLNATKTADEDQDDQSGDDRWYGEDEMWEFMLNAFKGKGWRPKGGRKRKRRRTERRTERRRKEAGYKCGGYDHPRDICPSKPGCTHTCTNCRGYGHYEDVCLAKPKEQRDPEKREARGNSKGEGKGGGKSQHFSGTWSYGKGQHAFTAPNTNAAPSINPALSMMTGPRQLANCRKVVGSDMQVRNANSIVIGADGWNMVIKTKMNKTVNQKANVVAEDARFFKHPSGEDLGGGATKSGGATIYGQQGQE